MSVDDICNGFLILRRGVSDELSRLVGKELTVHHARSLIRAVLGQSGFEVRRRPGRFEGEQVVTMQTTVNGEEVEIDFQNSREPSVSGKPAWYVVTVRVADT